MNQGNRELVYKSIDQFKETHDESCFSVIYDAIIGELTAHIYTYSAEKNHSTSESDISDIAQQAMIKIWKGLDSLSDTRAFFKWMNLTAERTCLDYWNLSSRRHEVVETTLTSKVDEEEGDFASNYIFDQYDANEELNALNRNELIDIIQTCMGSLDPDTQDVIRMRIFDELSYSEISGIMGLNENTIRSRLSRGKEKLGSVMETEAKKRGFKLYDVSFFSVFLFLHSRLSEDAERNAKALLSAGSHFGNATKDAAAVAAKTKVSTAVPFFSTKIGKAVVAMCVSVGVIGGAAYGLASANNSQMQAEEATVQETEETVTIVEAKYKAENFSVETNGEKVNVDSNPLNYIVVKDANGKEIKLTRESKKKYVYECDDYSIIATYDDRKLSDDEKTLSCNVTLNVEDKTVDVKATKKKHGVKFDVKEAVSTPATVKTDQNSTKPSPKAMETTSAHTHTWVTKKTTVVDKEAYDETVVDKEAYDETIVDQEAYDAVEDTGEDYYECLECGAIYYVRGAAEELIKEESNGVSNWYWRYTPNSIAEHLANDHSDLETSSYRQHSIYETVHHDAVTHTEHHDAVTHTVHHDAVTHTETTTTCSVCGAEK